MPEMIHKFPILGKFGTGSPRVASAKQGPGIFSAIKSNFDGVCLAMLSCLSPTRRLRRGALFRSRSRGQEIPYVTHGCVRVRLESSSSMSVCPGSVQGDRAALEALFDEASGLQWRHNTGWKEYSDLSGWYGVALNHQGRVEALSLPLNRLEGMTDARSA